MRAQAVDLCKAYARIQPLTLSPRNTGSGRALPVSVRLRELCIYQRRSAQSPIKSLCLPCGNEMDC
eukprot:812881-Rhodomonas_salina.3